jgi:hypothetical protein
MGVLITSDYLDFCFGFADIRYVEVVGGSGCESTLLGMALCVQLLFVKYSRANLSND